MGRNITSRRGLRLLLSLAISCGMGCIISPKPEPPQVALDLERVDALPVFGPTIAGGTGAASPPGASVWGWNLDREEDAANGVVREDGSFELDLPVDVGEEVRLTVVSEHGRSAPVDIVYGANAPEPALAPRPLEDCLSLEPERELDLREATTVTVESSCDDVVQIEAPRLRRPTPGLSVGAGASWPAILARGESLDVSVEIGPELQTEEVIFIEASAPEQDRRPITVLPR